MSPARAADVAVFRALRGRARDAGTIGRVRAFSRCGEHAACWLALGAAGAALDRRRRGDWRRGTRAVGLAYAANTALKQVARRPRPAFADLPPLISTPTRLSFPSAHASTSFAAARSFAPLVGPAGPVLYATAAAMVISRVYLGVHYPSDILAGAALGTVVGQFGKEGRACP